MIADPGGPSSITRSVGRRRYADDASVSHDPHETSACALRWPLIMGADARQLTTFTLPSTPVGTLQAARSFR